MRTLSLSLPQENWYCEIYYLCLLHKVIKAPETPQEAYSCCQQVGMARHKLEKNKCYTQYFYWRIGTQSIGCAPE